MVSAMFPPALLAQLDKVLPMISAAPEVFGVLVLGCLGVSLVFMHVLHSREIKTKAAIIDLLARERDGAEKKLAEALAEVSRLRNGVGTAACEPATAPTGSPDAHAARLRFVFGDDPPFSDLLPNPKGTEQRVVRVALVNGGGEHLDDCRVRIEQMTPGPNRGVAPFNPISLTADGFSLRPHGEKRLDVASYNERYPDGTAAPEIRISTPSGFFGVAVPADKPQTLRLRATAAGDVFAEVTCRLFVEDGQLRLVKR